MRIGFDEHGGGGVLLHYLQNFDLSKVDLDIIPKTAALEEQKEFSMNTVEEWWLSCLEEGSVDIFGFEGKEWPDRLRLKDVEIRIDEILRKRGQRNYDWGPQTIAAELKKFIPAFGSNILARRDGLRVKAKKLSELDDCRKEWDKYMNFNHKWDDTEI